MPFDGIGYDGGNRALVERIDKVRGLLDGGKGWIKNSWRDGGRRCLERAIRDATPWAMVVVLRADVTAVIKTAIKEVTGRSFKTIAMFNDDPKTDWTIVSKVLDRAREIASGGSTADPSRQKVFATTGRMALSFVSGLVALLA